MKSKRLKLLVLIIATLALVYVCCYALLLDSERLDLLTTPAVSVRQPSYHLGGAVAETLFAPANWVDRLLRPSYWVQRHGPSPEEIDAEAESFQDFEF